MNHVLAGHRRTHWVRSRMFATQKAFSILSELRGYVAGAHGQIAAELDPLDDGADFSPVLTLTTQDDAPDLLVPPDHPVSGNVLDVGGWRWYRKISVRPYMDGGTRDRRYCTVRLYHRHPGDAVPGTLMAEVSGVVQSMSTSYPSAQVYDLYVIALENHPGWSVALEGMRPFLEGAMTELESKSPGLEFRVHWITKSGFGRDEEYAPYTNENRTSTEDTPWVYLYPGRLRWPPPEGTEDTSELAEHYYDAGQLSGRVNVDGVSMPSLCGEYCLPEPFTDEDGSGSYEHGETFLDGNANDMWDRGNTVPYALADYHNHCMRWPEAAAKFQARVDAGLEAQDEPTLRLLLDSMVTDPDAYRNALIVNMHGELIPMPPVRNYSDAAKDPEHHPGWRVVTHPERIRPARVAGSDTASDAPRFRVYAYRTQFETSGSGADLTTQAEPFQDADGNAQFDDGEVFQDWNGNGQRDEELPITLVIPGGDFSSQPNASTQPSIRVQCLSGGIDADGDGSGDSYVDWRAAPLFPESFQDVNGNGIHEVAERFFDANFNGVQDPGETHEELDGNGVRTAKTEPLDDRNANGRRDRAEAAEFYDDANGNGRWDAAEPYWDYDGDGAWTPPLVPPDPTAPYVAWVEKDSLSSLRRAQYLAAYGEPFHDFDGNGAWTPAETLWDQNGNGVRDGGAERGEMFFEATYDATRGATILSLHRTPLQTPASAAGRGLDAASRLYDLDYVPCPMPATVSDADRFARDLYEVGATPKNTARWIVELPLASLRQAFESAPGVNDGDQADRILTVETRIGSDLTTGTMWPLRLSPTNRSVTHAWFFANAEDVPFSERYQFQGDPRHCPYADLDAYGSSFPHGYNWFFVNGFASEGSSWPAYDGTRMGKVWNDTCVEDVPRFLAWLRTALSSSEAVYTNMAGFNFHYLSLGADVGFDSKNPYKAIPVDGLPFGTDKDVQDNTMADEGTGEFSKSRKLVRSNLGTDKGLREDGLWWSKPWIGELWPDEAYATQWRYFGNLRAGLKDAGLALTYRLMQREDAPDAQQPKGTDFKNARGELREAGCTSFFMIGSQGSTFLAKNDEKTVVVADEGFELGTRYGFPLPTSVLARGAFSVSGDGKWLIDFTSPDVYPHYGGELAGRFYGKDQTTLSELGSAIVRHTRADGSRCARIVVNALHPATDSGPMFASRYALLSLLHTFLHEGHTYVPRPIPQVPRIEIRTPTADSALDDPDTITIRWWMGWQRWDARTYTEDYDETFAGDTTSLRYVLLYSGNGGDTWKNVMDDSAAELGVLPRQYGTPDPSRSLSHTSTSTQESYVWWTGDLSEGNYLLRVEAHRIDASLHYAHHVQRIYVER